MVTGPPHVRFYAGAPLRTQEGFNIGTLAIMDDTPRVEFSPRQRHTLKEFAVSCNLAYSGRVQGSMTVAGDCDA